MNDPEIQAHFDHLERDIRSLRVEIERYLNGALEQPPEEKIDAVAGQVRQLRTRVKGVADQFRVGAIEAQFNALREQFGRRMRQREIGGAPRTPPPVSRPAGQAEGFDPMIGIVVGDAVPNDAAEALHRELYSRGQSRVDPLTFKGFLERQATQLRDRTGCAGVRFRLAEENGQLRLKAKPVHRGTT